MTNSEQMYKHAYQRKLIYANHCQALLFEYEREK